MQTVDNNDVKGDRKVNEKLLSLLGLARRAGKLSMGFDAAAEAAKKGSSRLLLIGSNISDRTKRSMTAVAEDTGVPLIILTAPIESISSSVGKHTGIISVNDEGFAKKMKTLCEE